MGKNDNNMSGQYPTYIKRIKIFHLQENVMFLLELNLNNENILFFLNISQLTCIICLWSGGTNDIISDKNV